MVEFKQILLLCALVYCCYGESDPEVRIPLGRIKGSLMTTRFNKTIYAFRGIRYGKSPTGERRFKQAVPVDAWQDVFDASKEGPTCPRIDDKVTSNEDCLRLNVYTTEIQKDKPIRGRPVIVYFHPGGFYIFSAQSNVFGPQYLLDEDIVLVTVGYRLGTLGFIATGDARAPGNLGMKDQVEALRWIKKNIAPFGGNPNSVTITGYSAGSWSVILHMMSPMSMNLFHRAIAMSGTPTTPEPLPTEQKHLVIKQASIAGCHTDTLDAAFECLKSVPMDIYRDSLTKFLEWYGDPILIWSPVVEPEVPGVERFLTAQPADLIRQKKYNPVPLITGITKDEFASAPLLALKQALEGNDSIYQNITKKWDYAAPISFQYERNTPRSKYISGEIRKFYFHDEPLTKENGEQLGLIYADAIIGFPAHRTAMLMAANPLHSVYNYQFTYQGRYSFSEWKGKPYGVVHHDDLQYLFYMSYKFPFFNSTYPEAKMVDVLTAIWGHFAAFGTPIPTNNKLFKDVTWPRLDPKRENYLQIDQKLTIKYRMYPDRYKLYDRLFPLGPVPSFPKN